jgi:hypothetical protein
MNLTKGKLLAGFAIVAGGLVGVDYGIQKSTEETVQVTVTGKDVIVTGSDKSTDSKYLVYTNSETFENEDALFYGKFNSSDFQRKLEVNKTFNLTVNGWRIPFFSSYRNIVKMESVPTPSPQQAPVHW